MSYKELSPHNFLQSGAKKLATLWLPGSCWSCLACRNLRCENKNVYMYVNDMHVDISSVGAACRSLACLKCLLGLRACSPAPPRHQDLGWWRPPVRVRVRVRANPNRLPVARPVQSAQGNWLESDVCMLEAGWTKWLEDMLMVDVFQ